MSESPVPRRFCNSCIFHIIPTCRRFAEACCKSAPVAHGRQSKDDLPSKPLLELVGAAP